MKPYGEAPRSGFLSVRRRVYLRLDRYGKREAEIGKPMKKRARQEAKREAALLTCRER